MIGFIILLAVLLLLLSFLQGEVKLKIGSLPPDNPPGWKNKDDL